MPFHKRWVKVVTSFKVKRTAVILITSLLCLSACFAAPPPAVQQKFFAESYFQGAALELAQAVDRKDGAAISRLIKQEGLNPDLIFDEHNMPFVAWPVLNENEEGLRLLLEAGANPNARRLYPLRKDSPGANNAMVYAAGMEDQRFLSLLLDHGGDPNTQNSNAEALTYVAHLRNQWPNVQLLIQRGANVNYSTNSGGNDTVMAWYSGLGNFEQVYWLLQHGGDPTVKIKAWPGTPRDGAMPILEDIYYLPVQARGVAWQRKCQQWLQDKGIERPPIPEFLRKRRVDFGLPSEEQDIPVVLP